MNLYLVRHGEAKPKEEDPERPLSEKGWSEVRKMASFTAEHMTLKVNQIFHSGKTRARQTAEVLAEHLKTEGIEEGRALDPFANPKTWADRLAETQENVMLVGHLPYLDKLLSYLLYGVETRILVEFQSAGIVCLARDEEGLWALRWMLVPDMLT